MPKNAQTTAQLHSSHTAGKVMLKILLARLQQYLKHELPDVQAGFIKGRGAREQIANICWIKEKQSDFKKKKKQTPTHVLLTMPKSLTVSVTSVESHCATQ